MKKKMMMEKIQNLPQGNTSPSGKYWCVTCKKFFQLDKPECPYMTGMCVNTPIPVEDLSPESTMSFERFGLYYPKMPQKVMAGLIEGLAEEEIARIGQEWAQAFLEELAAWKVNYRQQPLQTVKSFILFVSGTEVAQRVNQQSYTFVVLDPHKTWTEKEKLAVLLEKGIKVIADIMEIEMDLKIDFLGILGEKEVGKYYCAKCSMFFEFGVARDNVTCPLMPQKCMFNPVNVAELELNIKELIKLYEITPALYQKLAEKLPNRERGSKILAEELANWGFAYETADLNRLADLLGLN